MENLNNKEVVVKIEIMVKKKRNRIKKSVLGEGKLVSSTEFAKRKNPVGYSKNIGVYVNPGKKAKADDYNDKLWEKFKATLD